MRSLHLKSGSSQLLRRRQFVIGSVLFYVGVPGILAGHIVGLLPPVVVEGVTIALERTAAEAQNHPAPRASPAMLGELPPDRWETKEAALSCGGPARLRLRRRA